RTDEPHSAEEILRLLTRELEKVQAQIPEKEPVEIDATQRKADESFLEQQKWWWQFYQDRLIENWHGRADSEDYESDLNAQRQIEKSIKSKVDERMAHERKVRAYQQLIVERDSLQRLIREWSDLDTHIQSLFATFNPQGVLRSEMRESLLN